MRNRDVMVLTGIVTVPAGQTNFRLIFSRVKLNKTHVKLTNKGFILFLLTVGFPVEIDVDVVDDGQVVKLEMLAPKAQIVFLFAGRPGVQVLVQTQFAKVPKIFI
jgi:hypothetical protein